MYLCGAVTRERITKSRSGPESQANGTRTWFESPRSKLTPRTVDATSGSDSVTYEIIVRDLMTSLDSLGLVAWTWEQILPQRCRIRNLTFGSWMSIMGALKFLRSKNSISDGAVDRYCQSLCKIPLFTTTKTPLTENTIFLRASSISERFSRIAKRKIHRIKGERRRGKSLLNVGQV